MDNVSIHAQQELLPTPKVFAPNVMGLVLLVQEALHINVLHVPKNRL
jgi:hypothetical protein